MSAGPEKDQEEKSKSRDLLGRCITSGIAVSAVLLCSAGSGQCCGLKRPQLGPQGLESSMAKI